MTMCKACTECDGDHHWIEACKPGFVGFVCKHCNALSDMCDECDAPVGRVLDPRGDILCEDCAP